jgi:hypothetical protein
MCDCDMAKERTPDFGDIHPALCVCPAKRPLSDCQAVDVCSADVDNEANFVGPVSVSPANEQNAGIDIAKHTQASLVKARDFVYRRALRSQPCCRG